MGSGLGVRGLFGPAAGETASPCLTAGRWAARARRCKPAEKPWGIVGGFLLSGADGATVARIGADWGRAGCRGRLFAADARALRNAALLMQRLRAGRGREPMGDWQ